MAEHRIDWDLIIYNHAIFIHEVRTTSLTRFVRKKLIRNGPKIDFC